MVAVATALPVEGRAFAAIWAALQRAARCGGITAAPTEWVLVGFKGNCNFGNSRCLMGNLVNYRGKFRILESLGVNL